MKLRRLQLSGSQYAWIVFLALASVVIGGLLVASRMAAAGEPSGPSAFVADLPSPSPTPEPATALASPEPAVDAVVAPVPSTGPLDAAQPPAQTGQGGAIAADAPPPAPPAPPPPPAPPDPPPASAPPVEPPSISGTSAAIIERSCGALVWGMNEHDRVPPASLTKIMTALVTVEHADPNAAVDIQIDSKALVKATDSTVMGLEPGMRLSVRDLLYGLILPSGNDAALELARLVAGGTPGFAALMNQKAAELGMTDSNFVNPHGLDTPGHVSSAIDMAKAGRAFLVNPFLAQIAVTPEYQPPWNGDPVKNGNKLLTMYPGTFGVKIGFTDRARQTIVAAADRNGRQLILAVMGSEDRYNDAIALFDWAFANTAPACNPG